MKEIFENQPKNFYEILEVSPGATQEEVRKAFIQLSKVHHPEAGGNAEVYKKITEAYAELKSPEKRKEYNQRMNIADWQKEDRPKDEVRDKKEDKDDLLKSYHKYQEAKKRAEIARKKYEESKKRSKDFEKKSKEFIDDLVNKAMGRK